jgi:hypothetical protein
MKETILNIIFKANLLLNRLAYYLSVNFDLFYEGLEETNFSIIHNQIPNNKNIDVWVVRLSKTRWKISINTPKTFNDNGNRRWQLISNNCIIQIPLSKYKELKKKDICLSECLVINDYSSYEAYHSDDDAIYEDKTIEHNNLLVIIHLNFIKNKSCRFYFNNDFHNSHGFELIVEKNIV